MGEEREKIIVDLVRSRQPEELSIKEIAQELGIWQQEASAAVSSLVKEGVLKQRGRSPVRVSLVEGEQKTVKSQPPFSGIIGSQGSLSMQIQMARAAVCYPPDGLHMLILGATGVGKTMLAREIWHYAAEERKKEMPFVTLNCAEYADNPQLLLSQLFGHEKGAFTGAMERKTGLIDQADGGILFLDEIHRLGATGQEILFSVMDHGEFRRLGGIQMHKVRLLLLCATTEDPDSVLLSTFKRRIPVVIQLPLLRERPIRERFSLVSLFFTQEASRTGAPIRVSRNVLEYLVLFESDSNIGDLKNEVLLTCAYGYMAAKSQKPEDGKELWIDSSISSRRGHTSQIKPELRRMFSNALPKEGLLFLPGTESPAFLEKPEHVWKPDFYESFSGMTQNIPAMDGAREELFHYVSPDVYSAANDLLEAASEKFQEFYPRNVGYSLAFFLQQIKSYARVGRGLMEQADHFMGRKYNREREFLKEHLEQLQKRLDTELTQGEISAVAFLLGQRGRKEGTQVGIVVAAYGEQIASNLAMLTLQVLSGTPILALDFPLDSNFKEFWNSLLAALRRADTGRGVILCTDINLLFSKEGELAAQSGTDLRIVPAVNTALLLELGKCVGMLDLDAGELKAQICSEYREYIDALFEPELPGPEEGKEAPAKKRSVIITYCVTGTGSAKLARTLLLEHPKISQAADIIPLGIMSDLNAVARKFGGRLRLAVGFLDPHLPNVPFVGLESVFTAEGLNRILLYLRNWEEDPKEEEMAELPTVEERLEIVDKNIKNIAPSLEPEKVSKQAKKVLVQILERCPEKPEADFAVRVYIHVIAMFERLSVMEISDSRPKVKQEAGRRAEFFQWLSGILCEACEALGLMLNETEVYYLMIVLPETE